MKTRQIVVVVTISVIILAFAGIGFAYTAMTSNTDNTAAPVYLTLYQSSDMVTPQYSESFDKRIGFNSETIWDSTVSKEKVKYWIADGSYVTFQGDTNHYAKLGYVYITVDQNHSSDDYDFSMIKQSGTMDFDTYTYKAQLQIVTSDTVPTKDAVDEATPTDLLTFNSSTGIVYEDVDNSKKYTAIKVTLYACLNGGNYKTLDKGTDLNEDVLDDVSFRFTAEVSEA